MVGTVRAVGFHDDSFAQDTLDQPGESAPWIFVNRLAAAGALNAWQRVPVGGEVRPELQQCIFSADIAVRQMIGSDRDRRGDRSLLCASAVRRGAALSRSMSRSLFHATRWRSPRARSWTAGPLCRSTRARTRPIRRGNGTIRWRGASPLRTSAARERRPQLWATRTT